MSGADQATRRGEWTDLLASSTGRVDVPHGLQMSFPLDAELATRLTRLVTAEQGCCAFLGLTVAFTPSALVLTVTAPPGPHPVLTDLFGAPR